MNECNQGQHNCQQGCINDAGGFRCSSNRIPERAIELYVWQNKSQTLPWSQWSNELKKCKPFCLLQCLSKEQRCHRDGYGGSQCGSYWKTFLFSKIFIPAYICRFIFCSWIWLLHDISVKEKPLTLYVFCYRCACREGFQLGTDGTSCIGSHTIQWSFSTIINVKINIKNDSNLYHFCSSGW